MSRCEIVLRFERMCSGSLIVNILDTFSKAETLLSGRLYSGFWVCRNARLDWDVGEWLVGV